MNAITRFTANRRVRPERPIDGVMTLTEHLGELRTRIIRCVLAVIIGAIAIIAFYDSVLDTIKHPYETLCKRRGAAFCGLTANADGTVNFLALGPLEGFSTRMRIGMYGGLVMALPVVMWQIWKFVVPALKANEKKYAIPFIVSSVSLFALGGFLAYATLEKALEFLISWAGSDVESAFQVSKYVSLVILMIVAFGVGFQFPVLLVFLQLVGVLKPRQLLSIWRYAIVAIVVIAAVITPSGDPISLAALSVPMVVLYFGSVAVGMFAERRRNRAEPSAST